MMPSLFETLAHVHGIQQRGVQDDDDVRIVDGAVDLDGRVADAGVPADRRALALGTVVRESLAELAFLQRDGGDERGGRLGALAASGVPANLDHFIGH